MRADLRHLGLRLQVLLVVVRAGDLGRHLADELGGEGDDLLLVEALRLEITVDRLGEDLHRAGLGFTIGHRTVTESALFVPPGGTMQVMEISSQIVHW